MSRKKRKKESEKPIKFFTLDTETRGLFGEIFRVGLFNGTTYHVRNEFKSILEILIEESKTYECHVYVHNLDFDVSKIADDIIKDVSFRESLFVNNRVVTFTTPSIYYHDTFAILPYSLDKICRNFGLEEEGKQDLTDHLKNNGFAVYDENGNFDAKKSKGYYFETVDPEEQTLNEYLEMDCRSLYTIVNIVREIAGMEKEDFIRCPTSASLSMQTFKRLFRDDYVRACSSSFRGDHGDMIEQFIRAGYYGGRTEVFVPQLMEGFHYDVNSLYPSVMKGREFPIGYYDFRNKDQKPTIDFITWKKTGKGAGFLHVDIYVPEMEIPPLPVKFDGKLIFPCGKLSGVWTFEEIDLAVRYGCKVEKVHQSLYWKQTAEIFTPFIEHYEKIKKTSKGSKRDFAKLVLNSLYGKFATNRDVHEYFGVQSEEDREESKKLVEKAKEKNRSHRSYINTRFNIEILKIEKTLQSEYIQPHLSAYITSYARILLYESMMEIKRQGGSVYYCDTDSIATDQPLPDDLIDPAEFGKWKLETTVDFALFLQPKLYYEEGTGENGKIEKTVKAKGIPAEIRGKWDKQKYIDLFRDMVDEENERVELFQDYIQRNKFLSSIKNDESLEKEVKRKKGLNLRTFQKRKIDLKENRTDPHFLYMYGEEKKQNKMDQYFIDYAEKQKQLEIDLDRDDLEEIIEEKGKIKIPKKTDPIYSIYKKLSTACKCRFFRIKGIPIEEVADRLGWTVWELLDDIKYI